MPESPAWQEIVAVPDPATEFGLIVPQMSAGGTVSEIDTVPEKWFSAVIVMVDVVDTPTFAGVGSVDVIVKSRNWKRATAEWASEPLVAVTVRV